MLSLAEKDIDRFIESYIPVTESGCWLWFRRLNHNGYGAFTVPNHNKKYKDKLAHRVSYTLFVGEIPGGLCVLHKCDIPSCVNPDHLFLGSLADNIYDMDNKQRRKTSSLMRGTNNGRNKLAEEQVIEIYKSQEAWSSLARKYNIGKPTVHKIKNKLIWKHLLSGSNHG